VVRFDADGETPMCGLQRKNSKLLFHFDVGESDLMSIEDDVKV
jgi:hypothetical protein